MRGAKAGPPIAQDDTMDTKDLARAFAPLLTSRCPIGPSRPSRGPGDSENDEAPPTKREPPSRLRLA